MPRTTTDSRIRQPRKGALASGNGSAWRRLKWNQTIRAGDRVLYAGGVISKTNVPNFEVGMMVANSGYFGIVRKIATPNVALCEPPPQRTK